MAASIQRCFLAFSFFGFIFLLGLVCLALRPDQHLIGNLVTSPLKTSFNLPSPSSGPQEHPHSRAAHRVRFLDSALHLTSSAHLTFHPDGREITEAAIQAGSQPLKLSLPAASQLLQSHILFERNDGQADSQVLYLSRGPSYSLFLTRTGATIVLPEEKSARSQLTNRRHRFFRLHFGGANPQTEVTGIGALPGTSNYFSGSDPKLWHSRIPQFAKVRYSNLYPGIDLIFYFRDGQLEYDVIASPGADPNTVNFQVEGARPSLTGDGDVAIKIGANELVRLRKPYAYQDSGAATLVPASYSLHDGKLSFALGRYDHSQPLTIDPALAFGTFISSNCVGCTDTITDIAADNTGVYLTGSTNAPIFPVTANGSGPAAPQDNPTFIVKIDPTGSQVLYAVFLGNSTGQSITVDTLGSAYVSGVANFPSPAGFPSFPLTTGVFSATIPPNATGPAAYATKLSPDGTTLLYSTLLQQPLPSGTPVNTFQFVTPSKIAVDSTGALYIAGTSKGNAVNRFTSIWMSVPVTVGAFQTTPGADFVLKLTPNASGLDYGTYIDGPIDSFPFVAGIVVDSSGDAYVAGTTGDTTFPTTSGAYQTSDSAPSGNYSGFVMKLNSSGTMPVYSTFFSTPNANTLAFGLGLDSHGQAVISGYSLGTLPVTPNQPCGTSSTATGGFVAKFNAGGSGLIYLNTFCDLNSTAASVAVDSTGAAFVVGINGAPATFLPALSQPIQGYIPNGNTAANIALKFDTSGNLLWSTFFGNNSSGLIEEGVPAPRIVLDGSGAAYILDTSTIPPTPNSLGPPSLTLGAVGTSEALNYLLKIAPSLGAPVPLVSPNQLSFTNQNVGTSSSPADVQVGNFGDAPISPMVAITGDFSETDNCSVALPGGQKCDINVVFKPSLIGPRTGTLTVSFGGNIPSQTVSLSGNAGASAVTLSPTSLSFPVQAIGTTSGAQQVTITNSGTGPLTISSLQTSGPFATTNTCGAPVAPSSDCTVQVTFTPTASGTQTGNLTITDNAANSPQTVALTGNVGTSAGPSVSLSPASLSFRTQGTGTTSAAQQVTVTNGGNAALTISSVHTTSQFASTNTCNTPVVPASSCAIQVTFTPSASGSQTGTLTIVDNATGSPQTVALSGTGGSSSGPNIGLGIPSGGSASATVTAGATATYALTIGGQGMSGTASLTCAGAPVAAACSVPASVALNATTASPLNVMVTTTARSQVWFYPTDPTLWLWVLAILGCLALGKAASSQVSPRLRWRLAPLLAVALCACGGGSSPNRTQNPNGTAAGTYTLVVTAKSGTTTQTQSLTLVVQ
jgi:hypothetical protein